MGYFGLGNTQYTTVFGKNISLGRTFDVFPIQELNNAHSMRYFTGMSTHSFNAGVVGFKISGYGFGTLGILMNAANTNFNKVDESTYFYVENIPAFMGLFSSTAAMLALPVAASSYDKEATKQFTKKTTEDYQLGYNQRQQTLQAILKAQGK